MGGKPNSAGRTVVLSSFLLGGPSGSGVATTVTIGAVAYPMMARAGFEKNAAGGLLAAGGLGAILSPPVLGAAAFLIAEFLKISYLDVIWMATIPTCLYYLSLLFMVELDAKRFGATAVPYDTSMSLAQMTRRYGFHFTSLIAVIVFMVVGYSPMLSVFYSTLMCFVLSGLTPETTLAPRPLLVALVIVAVPLFWLSNDAVLILFALTFLGIVGMNYLRPDTRATSKKLVRTLADGSLGVLNAATTCASAGIVVGVVTLTGVGHAELGQRARLCRAHVHLLLRGAVGSVAADRAVAVRRCRDHRRRPVSHHHAGMEIHAAGVSRAVRVRARSARGRSTDEDPQGRLGVGHRADHRQGCRRAGRAGLRRAELGAATKYAARARAVAASRPFAGVSKPARGGGGNHFTL
jgi:hypothetical protein